MDLKLTQAMGLLEQIEKIVAMETGEVKDKPLEGKAAAAALSRMFGSRKEKKK